MGKQQLAAERRHVAVTVVTVTYNNASGLAETLSSLASLSVMPAEVLVIDGASSDDTSNVLSLFSTRLPLRSFSEPDDGIYDAMNKGRRLAQNAWIHYLNAGDTVWGEPYETLGSGPALLPVRIHDETGPYLFDDFVKHGGFGYCHQGIVFPQNHPPYRTQFQISADLDLIITTFPQGLTTLPFVQQGGVRFHFGGISSTAIARRDAETRAVIRDRLPPLLAWRLLLTIEAKNLLPRSLRRAIFACKHRRIPERE